MVRIFLYLLTVLIVVLGLTFAILNSQAVSINFYVKAYTLPLSILLILSLVLGFIIGLSILLVVYTKLKMENKRIKHRIKTAEKETSALRSIPVKSKS